MVTGHYWVKLKAPHDLWTIASYDSYCGDWSIIGSDVAIYFEDYFAEIDKNRIIQKSSPVNFDEEIQKLTVLKERLSAGFNDDDTKTLINQVLISLKKRNDG